MAEEYCERPLDRLTEELNELDSEKGVVWFTTRKVKSCVSEDPDAALSNLLGSTATAVVTNKDNDEVLLELYARGYLSLNGYQANYETWQPRFERALDDNGLREIAPTTDGVLSPVAQTLIDAIPEDGSWVRVRDICQSVGLSPRAAGRVLSDTWERLGGGIEQKSVHRIKRYRRVA